MDDLSLCSSKEGVEQASEKAFLSADHAENGSSAGAEGASGSGGGSTSGKKRSDKGSANNNTSGSDEDGPGQNGNGSDGRTNNADLCAKGKLIPLLKRNSKPPKAFSAWICCVLLPFISSCQIVRPVRGWGWARI